MAAATNLSFCTRVYLRTLPIWAAHLVAPPLLDGARFPLSPSRLNVWSALSLVAHFASQSGYEIQCAVKNNKPPRPVKRDVRTSMNCRPLQEN